MFLLLAFPVLATLYALPLVFGWVGPNPLYGFRNARTRSNRALWYSSNRSAGLAILAAMAFCVVLEFSVPSLRNTHAGHLVSVVIQISAMLIANAWTTFRVIVKLGRRK